MFKLLIGNVKTEFSHVANVTNFFLPLVDETLVIKVIGTQRGPRLPVTA